MPTLKSARRIVGAASLTSCAVIAALTLASVPAGAQTTPARPATACPVVSIGNPNPGDDLTPGGYVISGTAYDPAATSGSGITRLDLFLGGRDTGGMFLGSATTGTSASGDPRAFTVKVTLPTLNRGVDFAAYALSSVTGQETVVTFPVVIGTPPKNTSATPTPIPTVTTVTSSCPTSGAATASAPAPAAAAAPAAPAAVVAPPAAPAVVTSLTGACPALSIGNPNPGDNLAPGGYFISGTAFDPAATSGSGITRIDLFLGDRDNGGTFLGSALTGTAANGDPRSFNVKVSVPALNRGADFTAYAISAITGQETVITSPVFVGVPPTRGVGVATPTPLPTTSTTTTTCHK